PEVSLGILPSAGGMTRLVRLLGTARAKELILLGQRFDAARALELGVINRLVAEGEAESAALEWAALMAEQPQAALQVTRELVNNAGGQFVAPAEDITPNGWEAVRRLNLDAPWYLTQQVAKRWMIPNRGGRVVSVVLCPTRGIPYMAHSSAARAGMSALTNTL